MQTIVPYNPNSNSVERIHRVFAQILRALGTENDDGWKKWIPAITLAINSTTHRTTQFSPLYLMTGRTAQLERR